MTLYANPGSRAGKQFSRCVPHGSKKVLGKFLTFAGSAAFFARKYFYLQSISGRARVC